MREGVHRRADRRGERQPEAQLGVVDRRDRARALVSAAALPAGSEEHPEVRRPLGSRVRRRDGDDARVAARSRVRPARRRPPCTCPSRSHRRARRARRRLPRAYALGRSTHRLDGHVRKDAVERLDDGKTRHRPRASPCRDEQRRSRFPLRCRRLRAPRSRLRRSGRSAPSAPRSFGGRRGRGRAEASPASPARNRRTRRRPVSAPARRCGRVRSRDARPFPPPAPLRAHPRRGRTRLPRAR